MRLRRGRHIYSVNKFPYGNLKYVGGDIKVVKEFFMNKKIILGLMLVCLLAFGAIMACSQSSTNVRWEYTTYNDDDLIQGANNLGQEGWELVNVVNRTAFFKRRLP